MSRRDLFVYIGYLAFAATCLIAVVELENVIKAMLGGLILLPA